MDGQEFWLWLFPLTYAVHVAEEAFAGERFYRWIDRSPITWAFGIQMNARQFFVLNAIFMTAMIAAVIAASYPGWAWVIPGLGTLVCVNAVGHVAGSIATRRYSPGLLSGILLWLPLGVATVHFASDLLPPHAVRVGIAAGILAQGLVGATAALICRRSQQAT